MSEKTDDKRSLATWDPFREVQPFFRGSLFRELAGRGGLSRWMDDLLGEGVRRELAPALDIHESDSEYVATVELPGVKKEDVIVDLAEGVLTVRGEKRSEREEKKERGRWVERSYGAFCRSLTLPPNATGERIDASFKDGVLTVKIPKREPSKSKTIAVK